MRISDGKAPRASVPPDWQHHPRSQSFIVRSPTCSRCQQVKRRNRRRRLQLWCRSQLDGPAERGSDLFRERRRPYRAASSPWHDSAVTERQVATHAEPARRDEANFIVRLDLTEHGMAGQYEQMWTRTEDQHSFELCCIPFFTYGQSIGDVLEVKAETGQHRVLAKSGHRTIRFCFTGDRQAHEQHQVLHGALAGELGLPLE
jgi:uncharacterized protein DUF4265